MSELPQIDRYTVEGELGRGAFGAVYRARHAVLGRPVALKVLHRERAAGATVMDRFLREARAVAQLASPFIVQVLDADVAKDGRAFIAMELLEGEDLAHRLASKGRLPTYQVVRIGRELCAGLSVAHAQGIVHRDLKPGNVFLARDASGNEVAKILDFGISKVRTEDPKDELTRTGTMLGTPQYMAPEQFNDSRGVDGRADVYALGVLLYEALAGRTPFDAETLHGLIALKLGAQAPPLAQVSPDVPHEVGLVIAKALETDPARRYASAAELDAALAQVQSRTSAPGTMTTSAPPPTSMRGVGDGTTIATPPPRSRVVPVIAGLAGLVVAGLFAMLVLVGVGVWLARPQIEAWLAGAPSPSIASPSIAPVPSIAPPSIAPAPVPSIAPPSIAPPPAPSRAPVPTIAAPAPPPLATDVPHTPTSPRGPRTGEAAAPDVAGVRVVSTAAGAIDADAVRALGDRARPALAACRTHERYHRELQFVVALMGGHLMGSGVTADPTPTDECVRDALVGAGPVVGPGSGIARFSVTLDPS